MSAPERIQRKRTKGWRMPEGAVYVGRPSGWGNPYSVVRAMGWPRWAGRAPWVVVDPAGSVLHPDEDDRSVIVSAQAADDHRRRRAAALAVDRYRECFETGVWSKKLAVEELAGRDLACWCPLEDEHGNRVPCHADVLLELANPGWTP